jgi:hypothetical protein
MTPTSERLSSTGAWLRDLHGRALVWAQEQGREGPTARTDGYIHLMFAFGLARLGQSPQAQEMLRLGGQRLVGASEAHTWLFTAFEYRIREAMDGKAHTGRLPTAQLESLESIDRLERFVVDHFRKHSRILEPDQRLNPYRYWSGRISEFEKALAELTDLTDSTEIASRVDKLLRETPKGRRGNEQRARVLRAGLEAALLVSEEFARKLLDQAIPAYDALPQSRESVEVSEQAGFLEKALRAAIHYQFEDEFLRFLERCQRFLQTVDKTHRWGLEGVVRGCVHGLFHFQLCDEADQFLNTMSQLVLGGRSLGESIRDDRDGGVGRVQWLLPLAAGWYAFGWSRLADPVLEEARALFVQPELHPRYRVQLALAANDALRFGTRELLDFHFVQLFDRLRGVRDAYTTASHFQSCVLDVLESVVLTAVEVCART